MTPCETAIELKVKQGILEQRLDDLSSVLMEIRDEIKALRPAAGKANIIYGVLVAVGASLLTLAFSIIGRMV